MLKKELTFVFFYCSLRMFGSNSNNEIPFDKIFSQYTVLDGENVEIYLAVNKNNFKEVKVSNIGSNGNKKYELTGNFIDDITDKRKEFNKRFEEGEGFWLQYRVKIVDDTTTYKILIYKNSNNLKNFFSELQFLEEIEIEENNTLQVKNISSFFTGCSRLKKITFENFDMENLTNFDEIFFRCNALEEILINKKDTNQKIMSFNYKVKHIKYAYKEKPFYRTRISMQCKKGDRGKNIFDITFSYKDGELLEHLFSTKIWDIWFKGKCKNQEITIVKYDQTDSFDLFKKIAEYGKQVKMDEVVLCMSSNKTIKIGCEFLEKIVELIRYEKKNKKKFFTICGILCTL